MKKGKIVRIAGPVVIAELEARMYDIVQVGSERLIGEVIQINGNRCTIQVYEDTTGLKPSDPVVNTSEPLTVELGPGLLSSIYDGIQRPLKVLQQQMGDFIRRGATVQSLDRSRKWSFKAAVKKGDALKPGQVIGEVKETPTITHMIMVPPGSQGKVTEIKEGSFTVDEVVCRLDSGSEIALMQKWPVRIPRPVQKKLQPNIPLVTGQRILDALFPLAKGGVAAIPGPFGSGKCVTGETPVFVNNQLLPIESVFLENKSANAAGVEENNEETMVELKTPLFVNTFDGTQVVQGVATHVYKGKTNQLVKVKTRSGRAVQLTPVHKLFKLTKSLEIVETPASQLQQGDFILSPRKLNVDAAYSKIGIPSKVRVADKDVCGKVNEAIEKYANEKNITKKEIASLLQVPYHTLRNYSGVNAPPYTFVEKLAALCGVCIDVSTYKTERMSKAVTMPKLFDEDFAEFLGYLMSDGMVKGSQTIEFFNEKKEVRERFSHLVKKLFGLATKEYYARTVWAVHVTSQAIVRLLVDLGYPLMKKSRNIILPKQLLTSPESVIRSFLKAYIVCDGHVGKRDVEITTASRQMRSGLCYLLSRLGILYRASNRQINDRTYYRIFISPREAIKIDSYYSSKFYFNSTDIVPMTSSLFKEIMGNTKPQVLANQGISVISYYKDLNQTALTFQKVVEQVGKQAHLKQLSQALEHVFCDEIKEIELIEKVTDVYDLTVSGTHNFIGGEIPMVLHNTVTQQALAKWSDADIIVYIGCGERGNEMTEVLVEFPHLIDPKTNTPLLNRTILIANTSNMPVAAREASVYTGITLAEYYRDMGYNVALMADSTSRWAEAMREISSRLEELPGEEGYPAYLSARLSEFYERAGRAVSLNGSEGSISVIGAVSPPGGDFSEPVTQGTLRVTKAFWALDSKLAQRRHFPAINWLDSYSLYLNTLSPWFAENVSSDWRDVIDRVMGILQEEEKLLEIVQLVGSDALPERQQITLQIARLIREFFLQQNSFHPVDTYSELKKTYAMMQACLRYADLSYAALSSGVRAASILSVKSKDKLSDIKFEKDYDKLIKENIKEAELEFSKLGAPK